MHIDTLRVSEAILQWGFRTDFPRFANSGPELDPIQAQTVPNIDFAEQIDREKIFSPQDARRGTAPKSRHISRPCVIFHGILWPAMACLLRFQGVGEIGRSAQDSQTEDSQRSMEEPSRNGF
jgi:hypothetical protein